MLFILISSFIQDHMFFVAEIELNINYIPCPIFYIDVRT